MKEKLSGGRALVFPNNSSPNFDIITLYIPKSENFVWFSGILWQRFELPRFGYGYFKGKHLMLCSGCAERHSLSLRWNPNFCRSLWKMPPSAKTLASQVIITELMFAQPSPQKRIIKLNSIHSSHYGKLPRTWTTCQLNKCSNVILKLFINLFTSPSVVVFASP